MCTGASDPHRGDSSRHSLQRATATDRMDVIESVGRLRRCTVLTMALCCRVGSQRQRRGQVTGGCCRPSVDCRGSGAAAAAKTSASNRASCAQPCTPLSTNQATERSPVWLTDWATSGKETQRRPSPFVNQTNHCIRTRQRSTKERKKQSASKHKGMLIGGQPLSLRHLHVP